MKRTILGKIMITGLALSLLFGSVSGKVYADVQTAEQDEAEVTVRAEQDEAEVTVRAEQDEAEVIVRDEQVQADDADSLPAAENDSVEEPASETESIDPDQGEPDQEDTYQAVSQSEVNEPEEAETEGSLIEIETEAESETVRNQAGLKQEETEPDSDENTEQPELSNPYLLPAGDSSSEPFNTVWDCIWFGNYYQNSDTVKEPVKWRVLSVNGNDAFLLADEILDCQKYDEDPPLYNMIFYSYWEISSLREWLNGYFYDTAFSEEEKEAVLTTAVDNPYNPKYGTDGGNETSDKVYLLSIQEASNEAYGFSTEFDQNSGTRACRNTWYASYRYMQNDNHEQFQYESQWLLRSPGAKQEYIYQAKPRSSEHSATVFNVSGRGDYDGIYVSSGITETRLAAVRPCLHIDLSSSAWSYAGKTASGNVLDEDRTASGILRQGEGWTINWECNYKESLLGEKSSANLKIYVDGENEADGYLYTYCDGEDEQYPGPWIAETGLKKEDFLSVSVEGTSVNPLHIITEQFMDYTSLKEVRFTHVEGMGDHAFENCGQLTAMNPDDDEMRTIGNSAFKNTGLTEIRFSSSLRSIGANAFQNCKALSKIDVPGSVENIGEGAFSGCAGLKKASVDGGVGKIADRMFKDCEGLTSFTFEDDITEIETSAFEGCKTIRTVNMPITLKNVRKSAFKGCTSLREVYYYGLKTDWNSIRIEEENENLTDAYFYFNNEIKLEDISYNFKNDRAVFNYPNVYKIPIERYLEVFSVPGAKLLYEEQVPWHGSCYGMAVTSALFNISGSTVVPSDFNDKASVGELAVDDKCARYNMTLKEFIETMQVSGLGDAIQGSLFLTKDETDVFLKAVKKEINRRQLAVIYVGGTQYNSELKHVGATHVLLGYSIEKISDNEERIYVYDPNRPMQKDYIKIDIDDNGQASAWSYYFNFLQDWGTGHPEEQIGYLSVDKAMDMWKNRERVKNNLLSVNASSFDIVNPASEVLVSVRDGVIIKTAGETYALNPADMEFNCNLFYCPAGEFSVVNMGSDSEEFETSLAGKNSLASVKTSCSQIHFKMDEANNACLLSLSGNDNKGFNASITSFKDQTESVTEFNGHVSGDEITFGIKDEEIIGEDIAGIAISKDGVDINGTPASGDKERIPVSSCSVENISDRIYTGKAITPSPVVKQGSVTLRVNIDYSVSYKNNINAGTAAVIITGKGKYEGSASKTFVIRKAENPLTVKAKTRKIKYAKLKKKKQNIAADKAFTVSGAQGDVTYKVAKYDKRAKKKIKVSNTGRITVRKGLKKGTYKLKVKVTAAGNSNYLAGTKTVTLKVRVK